MTIIERLALILLVVFSMSNLMVDSVGAKIDKTVACAMERVGEAVEDKISKGGSVDNEQLKAIVFKVLEDMQQEGDSASASSKENVSTDEEPTLPVAEPEIIYAPEQQENEAAQEEDVVEAIEEEVYLEDEGVVEAEIADESVAIAKEDDWKRLLIEKADTLAKAALILYPSWIIAKKKDGSVISAAIYMILAGAVLNLMGSDF